MCAKHPGTTVTLAERYGKDKSRQRFRCRPEPSATATPNATTACSNSCGYDSTVAMTPSSTPGLFEPTSTPRAGGSDAREKVRDPEGYASLRA